MTGVIPMVWLIGALIAGHICTNITGFDDFKDVISEAEPEDKALMIALLVALMLAWPLTIPFALMYSAWWRENSDG